MLRLRDRATKDLGSIKHNIVKASHGSGGHKNKKQTEKGESFFAGRKSERMNYAQKTEPAIMVDISGQIRYQAVYGGHITIN